MVNPDKAEPPLFTAIRLTRMMDSNTGQAEEVKALMDILKHSEKIMNILNNFIWSDDPTKQNISQHDKIEIEESPKFMKEALQKFVNAKIIRIEKFIRYSQILKKDMSEESKKLEEFENDWDKMNKELHNFDLDSCFNMSRKDSYDKADQIKNNISQTSMHIVEKLTQIENQISKKNSRTIAFLIDLDESVDSNDLYRLLANEP